MATNYNSKIVTSGLITAMDFANPKSFSPNTFSNGLDIYSWYVAKRGNNTGNACTVEQDFITPRSPVGGIPMKMNVTGNDPHISSYNTATWNISTVANLQTWRLSVYAKASTTLNNCQIYIFGANSSGVSVVSGSYIGITSKTITVTTEWQRFDHFITFNNANVAFIHMRLDGPNADGSGTTVWWDGLQVEPVNLTAFNSKYNANYSSSTDLITSASSTITNYPAFTGQNLSFDGVDDFLTIPNTSYPSAVSDNFSQELWFRVPAAATWSDGTNRGSIFTRGAYAGSHGIIRNVTDNSIGFWVRGSTSGLGSASATITRDAWYQVVGTWNGATARIYVNGALSSSANITLAGTFTSTTWFVGSIQAQSGAVGNRFQGDVSNLKIYNRLLTDFEVAENFAAMRGRFGI